MLNAQKAFTVSIFNLFVNSNQFCSCFIVPKHWVHSNKSQLERHHLSWAGVYKMLQVHVSIIPGDRSESGASGWLRQCCSPFSCSCWCRWCRRLITMGEPRPSPTKEETLMEHSRWDVNNVWIWTKLIRFSRHYYCIIYKSTAILAVQVRTKISFTFCQCFTLILYNILSSHLWFQVFKTCFSLFKSCMK